MTSRPPPLDVTIQAQVLDLMNELKAGMSIIFVTHDLGVISEMADRVLIMYGGRVCEEANVDELFTQPRHYTIGLIDSHPNPDYHGDRLKVIPGSVPTLKDMPAGCPFHNRCAYARDRCRDVFPDKESVNAGHSVSCHCWACRKGRWSVQHEDKNEYLRSNNYFLEADGLTMHFPAASDNLGRTVSWIHGADDVSFRVPKGKTLGVVGESGCGKSTVGKMLLDIYHPTSGRIFYEGTDIRPERRPYIKKMQLVWRIRIPRLTRACAPEISSPRAWRTSIWFPAVRSGRRRWSS